MTTSNSGIIIIDDGYDNSADTPSDSHVVPTPETQIEINRGRNQRII